MGMLFEMKYLILIMVSITLTIASISDIDMIFAKTDNSELKQLLKQADSLAATPTNDNYKDKNFLPPSNYMDLFDICHKQNSKNPSVLTTERFCFNTIIDKCQKNNLSAEECYALNFVSFKSDNMDIAVLSSAKAKMNSTTNTLNNSK
jgi:hypothetical protein